MISGNKVIRVIIVSFSERIFEFFREFTVSTTVALCDIHGGQIEVTRSSLNNQLIFIKESVIGFTQMDLLDGNVNDRLVVPLAIISGCYINKVIVALQIIMVRK